MRPRASLLVVLALGCGQGPAGDVVTLAGSPTDGFVDGAGGAARFGPLGDVVVDSAGVLYVADVFHAAIRRITPEGEVTTVAGGEEGFADGVGTEARFHLPSGLALEGDNVLYVADAFNAAIRRIDLSTAEVSTVVGRPGESGHVDGALAEALLGGPFDVDVEPEARRLWIADRNNNAIRIADIDTGEVRTVAGGASGVLDGVAGEAQFNHPASLVCDGDGGAWIAERESNTIRHVTSEGEVTTVLGRPLRSGFREGLGGDALLNRPQGIARTTDGRLVFAEQDNNILRLFVPGDGSRLLIGDRYDTDALDPERLPAPTDGPAGEARLRDPRAVAVDTSGTIYFADLYAIRVVQGWE